MTTGEVFFLLRNNLSLSKPPFFQHGVLHAVDLGMALCDTHEAGIPVHLELQGTSHLVNVIQVLSCG
jgi:hypothetical protein